MMNNSFLFNEKNMKTAKLSKQFRKKNIEQQKELP